MVTNLYKRQAFIFAGGSGSRMENKNGLPKHLMPIQVGNSKRPVIAYILADVCQHVDEVIVGTAYRASVMERYLARSEWDVQTLRMPVLDDMGFNALYAAQHIDGDVVAYLGGDTILHKDSHQCFWPQLNNLIGPTCPLVLLLGPQRPNPRRSTFDVDDTNTIVAVRASQETDYYRYSWLVAAIWREYLIRWIETGNHLRPACEEGIVYTIWPALTKYILSEGLVAKAIITSKPSFNINTRTNLLAAQTFLERLLIAEVAANKDFKR